MGWDRHRAGALAGLGSGAGIVVLVAVLALPGPLSGGPATGGAIRLPTPVSTFSSGHCGGALVSPNITGMLSVEGGPFPLPSVSNRTIAVSFQYFQNSSSGHGPPVLQCLTRNVTATTDSAGAFTADMNMPGMNGCSGTTCYYYAGPYDPVSVAFAGFPPAGYYVTSQLNGSTAQVDLVASLNSATLTPSGRTTVSLIAPVTLTAGGLAGDGSPSRAHLSFAWTVAGSGWTVLSGAGSSTLVVASSAGATLATVTAYVNGTYGGASLSAPTQSAVLTAVPTTATGGDVHPTALDEGTPASFTLVGTGSAGYSYTALFTPGLAATDVTAPCSGTPENGGLLLLNCTAKVTYPDSGTAEPSAILSNGYSASPAYAYPFVAVAAPLGIFVSPQPILAYQGTSTTLVVTAESGTGTAPIDPACLWPGPSGVVVCEDGGPSWTFQPTYGTVGTFTGHVTVADVAGANVSVPIVATISARPQLSGFTITNETVTEGTAVALSSTLSGGALPARFWWNDSALRDTLDSNVLVQDGPINYTFNASTQGWHNVTLTVVDALGTSQERMFSAFVTPGAAARIDPAAPGATWTTRAGTAYNVSWRAVDAYGDTTTHGTDAVQISLAPGSPQRLAWLNDSTGTPILPGPGGTYVLPSGEWVRGFLNFSVDAEHVGTVALEVSSLLPLGGAPTGRLNLTVQPDLAHLLLSDPVWATTGPQGANCTRWTIADRFQNPLTQGFVIVRTDFGGVTTQEEPSVQSNGTVSFVWVNYTVPFGTGGTVSVLNPFLSPVLVALWTFSVAGPPAVSVPTLLAPFALLALAVMCLAVAVRGRRPRPSSAVAVETPPPPPSGEDQLMRLALGRAHVLSRADPIEPRELSELARGWTAKPPDPAELTEWVSSLVTEGALRVELGPDGKPRFRKAPPGAPPPTEAPPRIEIDAAALEAALALRPEPERAPDPDEPAVKDDAGSG